MRGPDGACASQAGRWAASITVISPAFSPQKFGAESLSLKGKHFPITSIDLPQKFDRARMHPADRT
jgi:hypothetical protein